MTSGTPTIDAGPDREELGRLELEVGAGEVAGEVRPEVALLDDPVEAGERHALGDQLGDAALAGRRRPCSVGRLPDGVALEAVGDARAAPDVAMPIAIRKIATAATPATASVIGSTVSAPPGLSR